MSGTCQYAASVARNCAAQKYSQEYRKLSSLMCWDAVAHCALLANVIDQSAYKTLSGLGHTSLVQTSDPVIANAAAMGNLPEGHIIGFFEGEEMIHAMISTGNGKAAGNKNDCVGVGHWVGWEELNLVTGLKWSGNGQIKAPSEKDEDGNLIERDVTVHHKTVTDL